jgi:hypothetical protein
VWGEEDCGRVSVTEKTRSVKFVKTGQKMHGDSRSNHRDTGVSWFSIATHRPPRLIHVVLSITGVEGNSFPA